MTAKLAEDIHLFTISDNKISVGGGVNSFCVGLLICLCSPNHDDLKVQVPQLAIFIRCTW